MGDFRKDSSLIRRLAVVLFASLILEFTYVMENAFASTSSCIEGTHFTVVSSEPRILKFFNTSECNFLIPSRVSDMQVLAVGGGGGGGMDGGSGGGGGELRFSNSFSVSSLESLTIKIGSGGSGGTYTPYVAADTGTATTIKSAGVIIFQANAGQGGNTWAGSGPGLSGGAGGTSGIGGTGTPGQTGGRGPTASCLSSTIVGESPNSALTPTNSITGSEVNYGGGGGGGITNNSRGSWETATVGAAGGGTSGGQGASYRLQLNGNPSPSGKGTSKGGNGTANTGGGGGGGGACSSHSNSGATLSTSETWDGITYSAGLTVDGRVQRTSGGNGADGVVIISYTLDPLPNDQANCPLTTITSISPLGGPSSGGTRVTISGQGLSSSVYIAGRLADLRLASSTSVTVLTPAGSKGSATIRIDGCGSSASTTYLYDPDPVISSLSSLSISTLGGTITITGAFLSGASLSLDGSSALLSTNTDEKVIAVLPPSTPGEKTLTLSTSFGSATKKLNYISPPLLAQTLPSNYLAQEDLVSLSFAATGATSYSSVGTLPVGLTLNSLTGALTGKADKEGVYIFSITASNSVGSDTKSYTIDVDKPTPRALSANIYFAHRVVSLSATNRSSLDRLIKRIKAVAPRNLSATITITGGDGGSARNLTSLRHDEVKKYLDASGIRIKSVTSIPGNPNKIGVTASWVR